MHANAMPAVPAANLRVMHAVSAGLRDDYCRRQPRPHSTSGSDLYPAPDAMKHEDHRPASPTLRCAASTSSSVEEDSAEVVFQHQGAWDFPLSRTEKVRRLLLLFESEAEAHELEAMELRKENENLKQQLSSGSCPSQSPKSALRSAPSISAVTRSVLAASSEELPPRRRSCTIVVPEDDSRTEAKFQPQSRTSPISSERKGFLWNSAPLSEATRSVSSPRQISSPPRAASPEPSGTWCPPAQPPPRRRRRTTIFRLPPEATGDGDAECSSSTVPVRARRRTAPPSAAALAAAQAAAEHEYDAVRANCIGDGDEVAVLSSPPCSPPDSPRGGSELRNRGPPDQAFVQSPCVQPHKSSIKLLQWSKGEAVTWMRFVTHIAGSATLEDHLDRADLEIFELLPGEYVQAMRGYAQVAERGIADWVDLVTSTSRSVTLGSQKHCGPVEPSFTCVAETGQEICGFTLGSNGCICDAQLCLLDGFQ